MLLKICSIWLMSFFVMLISRFRDLLIMEWRERGYTIFVTGDHGINADGNHGGTTSDQRDVPLFVIQSDSRGKGDTGEIVSHLQIAPTILKLLEVQIPNTMKHQPLLLD